MSKNHDTVAKSVRLLSSSKVKMISFARTGTGYGPTAPVKTNNACGYPLSNQQIWTNGRHPSCWSANYSSPPGFYHTDDACGYLSIIQPTDIWVDNGDAMADGSPSLSHPLWAASLRMAGSVASGDQAWSRVGGLWLIMAVHGLSFNGGKWLIMVVNWLIMAVNDAW